MGDDFGPARILKLSFICLHINIRIHWIKTLPILLRLHQACLRSRVLHQWRWLLLSLVWVLLLYFIQVGRYMLIIKVIMKSLKRRPQVLRQSKISYSNKSNNHDHQKHKHPISSQCWIWGLQNEEGWLRRLRAFEGLTRLLSVSCTITIRINRIIPCAKILTI